MRCAAKGRYMSWVTSSSRLHTTLIGLPGMLLASSVASNATSQSVRRPKPPPRNGRSTFTLSGLVPPAIEPASSMSMTDWFEVHKCTLSPSTRAVALSGSMQQWAT